VPRRIWQPLRRRGKKWRLAWKRANVRHDTIANSAPITKFFCNERSRARARQFLQSGSALTGRPDVFAKKVAQGASKFAQMYSQNRLIYSQNRSMHYQKSYN
jgi:hypothetical protein